MLRPLWRCPDSPSGSGPFFVAPASRRLFWLSLRRHLGLVLPQQYPL